MVGLGRIAGRRTDTGITFRDQFLGREGLVRRIAPEFATHLFMHALGKSLGKPVGQCLDQDRGVVVIRPLEALGNRHLFDAGRHNEPADVILQTRLDRRHEVRQGDIRPTLALGDLLAQREKGREFFLRLSSLNSRISSPTALAGQKPITARGRNQFSAMIFLSMACASANSCRAASPCFSSSRIAG